MSLPSPPIPCPACRALLEPALPLCTACGRPESGPADRALTLVVERLPDGEAARREVARLVASTGGGLTEAWARRYLADGRAVFLLPGSRVVASRIIEALDELGAVGSVAALAPEEASVAAYARTLWNQKRGLAPLVAGLGLSAVAVARGLGWGGTLLLLATFAVGLLDRRRFLRRITLRATPLARRLGLPPEPLLRAASALVRRARSDLLRAAIAAVLVEQARLGLLLARLLREQPLLGGRVRDALDGLAEQALRLAERAAIVEEADDSGEPGLEERVRELRALGNAAVERSLADALAAARARHARLEELRQAHALLVVRLEILADRLRTLRQRSIEARLGADPVDDGTAERLLGDLTVEIEVAVAAINEIDRSVGDGFRALAGSEAR